MCFGSFFFQNAGSQLCFRFCLKSTFKSPCLRILTCVCCRLHRTLKTSTKPFLVSRWRALPLCFVPTSLSAVEWALNINNQSIDWSIVQRRTSEYFDKERVSSGCINSWWVCVQFDSVHWYVDRARDRVLIAKRAVPDCQLRFWECDLVWSPPFSEFGVLSIAQVTSGRRLIGRCVVRKLVY